jgi:retron-type reverse transcriptase
MSNPAKPALWEQLTSFENLYRAAKEAQRGKRFKPPVARFHYDLASSLIELRDELKAGRYEPGPYHTFTIYEPARRFISAAPYRDRVVHHALCQVIEPFFERSFIFDSYANRIGKGTHRALDRCTEYCRRFRYVFQGDVRLFFPSIDMAERYRQGQMGLADIQRSVAAWIAHAKHGNTNGLRRRVLNGVVFRASGR